MLQTVLGYINFGILLILGVFVSAAFSGVMLNKKNIFILCDACVFLIAAQMVSYAMIGMENTEKLYPLISHLPLVLLLTLYYRRKIASAVFAVMAAYLCCQISQWFGQLGMQIYNEKWLFYLIRIVLNIIIGILLLRYIAPLISFILAKPVKTVFIFSILPIVYYIFDYASTVYTNWLYSGNTLVFDFLPFTLSVIYLIFTVFYFKEYEQKSELERQKQMIEIQAAQSVKEIEAIRASAYETYLLRHDMRHYLQNIYSFIENGNSENALLYIKQTLSAVDSAAVNRFCANELVNTVLSYYKGMMDKQGIRFDAAVSTEEQLPCSEQEFSSILSNGLENAVKAVSALKEDDRTISLLLKSNGGKLLLSIKNPYAHALDFVDGIPVATKDGHGFGTQSIRYVTHKLKGNCQFTAENNLFTLRVVV